MEELERKAKAQSIQYTDNSLVGVRLLTDIEENWIFQAQALSKTSGMDSIPGKSTHASLSIQDLQRKS